MTKPKIAEFIEWIQTLDFEQLCSLAAFYMQTAIRKAGK